jgi:heat shock protein 1/8
MSDNTIIGIDLGTTFSCVAVWKDGRVEIIANDQGERTTPSWVAFTETDRIIGVGAKTQAGSNPENTIYDSKRLIGRTCDDSAIQADLKHWPFKVKNSNNKPSICVQYKNENLEFTPEEISAMILSKMKETAENFLGFPVTKAVITVPAYFNDAQRRATQDAGKIAGLRVERIINEPTAAAMAYGLDKMNGEERTVLIFDCGGGTLDVSLLILDKGLFEVKATSGNTYLGGEDFDNKIVTWCLKEFKAKNKSIDVNDMIKNKKVLSKLKSACERAKKTLSSATNAVIEVDSLYNNIDFKTTLSRAKFEILCDEDFKKCLEPVQQVMKDADMTKNDITDIVLVGGSTRIPKIKSLLKEYFDGKDPKQDINPDEAVAFGAAIQGAILSKIKDNKIDCMVLVDVAPLSLGIETAGGAMAKIITRNSTIPCKKEQVFSTYSDNQPGVTVKIFEGEREFTKHNNLLGTFELTDIPPMPRGIPKINVVFDIDANGIMNVSATEESTNKTNKITIKNDDNRFTSEQLNNMIADAKKFEVEDKKNRERLDAKNGLENYIYAARNSIAKEDLKQSLGEDDCQIITELINETLLWLEEKDNVDMNDYCTKKNDLEKQITPLILTAHSKSNTIKKSVKRNNNDNE